MNRIIQRAVINNVSIATINQAKDRDYQIKDFGLCRRGTCWMSIPSFSEKFGNPHEQNFTDDGLDGAGKVHVVWYINTPRGIVDIRDYWWNGKNELSIASGNNKSLRWAKYWLRIHGVKAE